MSEQDNLSNTERLTSPESFNKNYDKILVELDALSKGVYDDAEASNTAALCLLAKLGLNKILAGAESKMRGYKRDIDFAKADAYFALKESKTEGKKLADTTIAQLVLRDATVRDLYSKFNLAEKEAKELDTILGVLTDAHLTFRTLVKKGG